MYSHVSTNAATRHAIHAHGIGMQLAVFGGYQSIASSRSHGYIVPEVIFDSTIHSHEIEQGDNLMLISLAAQGTLGLVKDVAAGTCYMKGEQIWMQLYSIAGSSLRAVCVFDPSWLDNTAMHSVDSSTPMPSGTIILPSGTIRTITHTPDRIVTREQHPMIDTEVVQEHYVRPSRSPRLTTLESDVDTDGEVEDDDADADRRARERAHHRRSTRSVAAPY